MCQTAQRSVGWYVPPFEAGAARIDPGAVVGSVAIALLLFGKPQTRCRQPRENIA